MSGATCGIANYDEPGYRFTHPGYACSLQQLLCCYAVATTLTLRTMRTVNLDAKNWRTGLDFYRALLAELGAPEGHACNLNAIIDSIIWGGANMVEPPYIVRILGTEKIPKDASDEIELVRHCLDQARIEFRVRRGRDVEVGIEIVS